MLISAIKSYGNSALSKSTGVKKQQLNFKGEDKNLDASSKGLPIAQADMVYAVKNGGKVKRACVDIERMNKEAEAMLPNLLKEAGKIVEESHECKKEALQKLAHVVSILRKDTDSRLFYTEFSESCDVQRVVEELKDGILLRKTTLEYGRVTIQEGFETLPDGSLKIQDEYVFIDGKLFAKSSNITKNADGSMKIEKEMRYKDNSVTECIFNEELSPTGDASIKCAYMYNPESALVGYQEDLKPYNKDSLKAAKQLLIKDGKELDCYSKDLDIFGDDAKILKQLTFKNGKPDYYIYGASLLGEKSYVALQRIDCEDGKPSRYYDGVMKAQDGSFTYLRYKKI